MKPVAMTVLMDDVPEGRAADAVNNGHPAGDCLRACVASILGIPPESVPHFAQYIDHPEGTDSLWWWALVGFCAAEGWTVTVAAKVGGPPGWSLADGWSPRGHRHVCVAHDGLIVHDPHPSGSGLTAIERWYQLEKVAA